MLPSLSLLIAVAAFLLQELLDPGQLPSQVAEAPAWLPLAFLPLVVGTLLESSLHARLHRGIAPARLWRLGFLVYAPTSALAFVAILWLGHWQTYLAIRLDGRSHTLVFALTFLPFLVGEFLTRWREHRIVRVLAAHGYRGLHSFGLRRLRECALLLLLLAFPLLRDLLELRPGIAVAVSEVAAGELLLAAGYIVLLALIAPDLFRLVQGVQPLDSQWLRDELEDLARRIGFRFRQLLFWRTGEEVTNAAIVGTFPWNRFVLLSDGLTAAFDLASIRAVFAHEAGHALRHHGVHLLVLVVGLPLMALAALSDLGWIALDRADPETLVAAAGVAVFALLSLRWASHRFEIEADLFSAAALGGAEPGIRALSTLADQLGHVRTRSSWRHPSLDRRIALLLRAEGDPAWQQRWRRRGTRVFLLVYLLFGALAGYLLTGLVRRTPLDLCAFAVYTGRVADAEPRLEPAPPVHDVSEYERLSSVRRSLELMHILAPRSATPAERIDRVRLLAPRRAARALEQGDVAQALEWLELTVSVGRSSSQSQLLYHLCGALAHRDPERAAFYRAYLREVLDKQGNERLLAAIEDLGPR